MWAMKKSKDQKKKAMENVFFFLLLLSFFLNCLVVTQHLNRICHVSNNVLQTALDTLEVRKTKGISGIPLRRNHAALQFV